MRFPSFINIVVLALAVAVEVQAGGPLVVAGAPFDPASQGRPAVWNTSTAVAYRTPEAGALGRLSNVAAVDRVRDLFQVWENVPTANIRFQRAGVIMPSGAYTGGEVNTEAEFDAIENSCAASPFQSPIIFDATGALFTTLGVDEDVIGFAGPCVLNFSGQITAARAALNGKWIDNDTANHHLTDSQFDETFVHEFGHFIGLDHSQISLNVLNQPSDQCNRTDLEILPVMFPFAHCQARVDAAPPLPRLSPDDEAWVSMLYRETVNDPATNRERFADRYGIIQGNVFFHDGETMAQGFNVLARDTNVTRNRTFSVVSGYAFTSSIGQSVSLDPDGTPNNANGSPFGSRDLTLMGSYEIPVLPGTFDVTVEEIFEEFENASSVGPLFPIPLPGSPPAAVSVTNVTAGSTATAPDIDLNDQLPRFDQFEGR